MTTFKRRLCSSLNLPRYCGRVNQLSVKVTTYDMKAKSQVVAMAAISDFFRANIFYHS